MLGARDRWRKITVVGILPAALLVTGCSDGTVYETPYLRTRIIDATTTRPIPGASVAVWSQREPEKTVNASSDADGNVLVSPLTRRALVFGPWDPVPPSGKATIKAFGYVPVEIGIGAGINDTNTVALWPSR